MAQVRQKISEAEQQKLQELEAGLNPARPEKSRVPVRILGYGEISTVFELKAGQEKDWAYKRMPLFRSRKEADRYLSLYWRYSTLLEEAGLHLPAHDAYLCESPFGCKVLYLAQTKLEPNSIGSRAIHRLSKNQVLKLFLLTLREIAKVFLFNLRQPKIELGLDGQISNWAIAGFKPNSFSLSSETKLLYLDTSTPLFRVHGREQLNPELLLRSTPVFLTWIIRLLFLEEVMTRYYDVRKVVIDLMANFIKEGKGELIPQLVEAANRFFLEEWDLYPVLPVKENEVQAYYRQDALIWRIFLFCRKVDRFYRMRIRKVPYPFILPSKIKR